MKIILIALLIFCPILANAQVKEPEYYRDPPPGISKEDWIAAYELYVEGNNQLKDSIFVKAAEKYRESLKRCHCEHPVVLFNLAQSLLFLDRPIEMHQCLETSIKNGLEHMGKEQFNAAKRYLKLLDSQLVHIKIKCGVPGGAQVLLDGGKLFDSPGQYEGLIKPGVHNISALKEGLYPNETRKLMEGGQSLGFNLELKSEEQLTEYRRHIKAWKPYAVVAAGGVVALAGGGLYYIGSKKMHDIDKKIKCEDCGQKAGLSDDYKQGLKIQKIAIITGVAGATAILAGGIWAYWNRAIPYRKSYQVEMPVEKKSAINISPIISGETNGILATINY